MFDLFDLMLIDMNLGDMIGIDLVCVLYNDCFIWEICLFVFLVDVLLEQIDVVLCVGFEGYFIKLINFGQLLVLFDGESGIGLQVVWLLC